MPGTIRAPLFAADTKRSSRPAAGKVSPRDAEHSALPWQWGQACHLPGGLSPPLRCQGTPGCPLRAGTPAVLAAPRAQLPSRSQQLPAARAWHGWCFTGRDWDMLEEGPFKAGWSRGRGPGVGLIPKTQIALIISQDCEGK